MGLIKTFFTISVLAFISCNSNLQKESADNSSGINTISSNTKAPIVFTIDGNTRTISSEDRVADVANLQETPVRYLFREKRTKNEKPRFDITFVFSDKENLADLPKTYNLTENPALQSIASLSFMDYEREVEKSLNKRLIFNRGTIIIHEITPNSIHFEFEGEVHELANNENRSPVSGYIQVRYE